MTGYIDLLPVIVERERAVLPEGFDSWALQSTRPDLTTYRGYRWPFPGAIAEAPGMNRSSRSSRSLYDGDGLCIATTWYGMSLDGFPARTLLLLAYSAADAVVGGLRRRVCVSRAAVVSVVDGERLLRECGSGANLYGGNLIGASLSRARLTGANLTETALYGADLTLADLSGADLSCAGLRNADLTEANLRGTDLSEADLTGASLYKADLTGADLTEANLARAEMTGAVGVDG